MAISASPLPSDGQLVAQARGLVVDLFEVKPAVYWTDLLITAAIGYAGFFAAHREDLHWGARLAAFVLCSLAFYRAALFTHELVHISSQQMRGYRFAWNTLIGIPLLAPSFLYYTHLDHHRPKLYATQNDGEYLPLAHGPVRMIFSLVASGLVVPALVMLRFLVLTPASWCSVKLRELIHRYASALVIDASYARPSPNARERRIWRMQEVLCLLYLLTVAVLIATHLMSWTWVAEAYLVAAFVLTINALRTLAAHRYRHEPEGPYSLIEQLLDSINHPRRPLLTEIWAPAGLRFHALHHLLPGLPYHALPEAHRRLTAGLPADSPYHQTNSPGLWATLRQLWRDATSARRAAAESASADDRARQMIDEANAIAVPAEVNASDR